MKFTRRQFSQLSMSAAAVGLITGPSQADEGVVRAHGGSLLGDLKYGPDFPHFDYVNPDAPKGGRVVLAGSGGFDSFNPFIVKGKPPTGILRVFDDLMTPALDQGSTQYSLLAEWYEHPADFSWVSYKIRDEARWHDGQPVTAADVVWTFKTLVEKGVPQYRLYYGNIVDAKDQGDNIVRFDFDQTGNRELPQITGQLTVLPMHWWAERDFAASSLEPPLGSGPYKVRDFEANRFVEYERVKDYWGADLPVNKGAHNFDFIRYDYYRDSTAAFEAFKAGDVDYRSENSAKKWALEYDFPAVKRGDVIKEGIVEEGPKQVQFFAFNLRRKKFQNLKTRRALSLAFDFEWTNKAVFFDQYARPSTYFQGTDDLTPKGAPEGLELSLLEPFRDKVPPEVFGPAYQPPKTDGGGRNRKGLRAAAALLKEAGWIIEDGKLVDSAGQPFAIEFLTAQESNSRVIDPFLKNLRRLGVQAKLRIVDQAQYIRRVAQDPEFDWDMIVSGVANSESPGNEQREYWGSDAANRVGSRNRMGVADPVVDALAEKIIFAENREELAAASRAFDRVVTWNEYAIMELYAPLERLAHWNKFGHPDPYPPRSYGMPGSFPSVWWWDAEKAAKLEGGQ